MQMVVIVIDHVLLLKMQYQYFYQLLQDYQLGHNYIIMYTTYRSYRSTVGTSLKNTDVNVTIIIIISTLSSMIYVELRRSKMSDNIVTLKLVQKPLLNQNISRNHSVVQASGRCSALDFDNNAALPKEQQRWLI